VKVEKPEKTESKAGKIESILRPVYYSLSILLATLLIVATLRQLGVTSITIAFITIPIPEFGILFMIFQIFFDTVLIYNLREFSQHINHEYEIMDWKFRDLDYRFYDLSLRISAIEERHREREEKQ
jgi:hypothetical protein